MHHLPLPYAWGRGRGEEEMVFFQRQTDHIQVVLINIVWVRGS
jgi:hypothetical protein